MKLKPATSVAMTAVLLFGLLAVPAAGQTNDRIEGFDVDACVEALQAQLDGQDADLEAFFSSVPGFLADPGEEPDLSEITRDDLPEGLSLAEICTIYGADVLGVVIEREDNGEEEDVAAIGVPTEPDEVLGVQLAVTGADTIVMVAVGLLLAAIGALAIWGTRRPRSQG